MVALLALLGLVGLAARLVFPQHHESREHLERKREYLKSLTNRPGAPSGPNLVVILFDDLGYSDLGVYGGRAIRTPRLDALAARGARFTHAYSSSAYCSASRAGLLTGRHAYRSGLDHVLQPSWTWPDLLLRLGGRNRRLPSDEILLSEALSAAGYATGIFGKWHLGDAEPALPNDLGFDEFFGLLHSNDQGRPAVYDGRAVVERHPVDQETLTRRYTERALRFLEANRERRFFLYLPHTFPHIPLHVAGDRRGRSPGGLYGDVVEELDESVGTVLAALARYGLERDTLVIATSDNGPWFQGGTGPARGRKLDIFEGGMRVPLIAAWEGHIAPGRVIEEPVMGIDLVPTVLDLAGLPEPRDRALDGVSLRSLFEKSASPAAAIAVERPLFFYQLGVLRAVRRGRFKYHDRHRVAYGNPMNWPWGPAKLRGPWLFDLEADPGESYDATDRHPDVAAQLGDLLAGRRRDDRRNRRGWL